MRSRTERISTIENALQSSQGTKKIPWRGGHKYIPVITLHSEMLMYRIENSRTSRQQQAYIKQHSFKNDFFLDQESKAVQDSQNEILLKLAKSQQGFLDDLKQRKQQDELIITRDGYIVNGNRRTSALRDIGVNYFNCAVLPVDTTSKDIYALEQELQIATDFRMDYDWVNELNNIREGIMNPVYAFSERELADNLRITSQALKSKLKTIELIDQFLDWKNESGNYAYEKLDKLKQAFEDLEKGMKKFSDNPTKQVTFRNEVFTLMDNPPRPGEGRIYDYIRFLIRDFDSIQGKLGVVETIDPESSETSTNEAEDDDFMGDIIGDSDTQSEIEIPFTSGAEAEEGSKKIYDAINDADAEHKDNKDAQAIFISAKKALRALSGLIVDENTSKKEEAIATLLEVIKASNKLIGDLKK